MAQKKKASRAKKKAKPARGAKRVAKPKVASVSPQGLDPANLQAALRESIERDIADRTEAHQRAVARIKANLRRGQQPPLMLLAHGDSWFDYPCNGNIPTLFSTSDIIAHLRDMGNPPAQILNLSHHGDATTDEMGLGKQQRLIKALTTPKNWLSSKPDAILFSGGGNDIAGDPFIIYLNYKDSGSPGLDPDRFAARLASIRASYLDLFMFRTRYAANVPIFGHCYDLAHPMKPHPPCAGPWMSPALNFTGWNANEGTVIIHEVLERFKAMLLALAATEGAHYDFTVVPTQGTLTIDDWANELHAKPPSFKKLAETFLSTLQARFPGRI